jgi:iron complex transport system substrate-binding protein
MRWPVLLALTLAACGAGTPAPRVAPARPVRVMSLNQCTDQLVLALLPPSRIASVTWLSRDPRYSDAVAAARMVPVNRGGVEEVVTTKPDLIVTDTFSNAGGRAILHRLGYPMVELPDASDVGAIAANIRTLAAAVGERARGEAMIAAMTRDLSPSPLRPTRVAVWTRDGLSETPLLALAIRAAGYRDVTPAGAPADVETLLALAPDRLITMSAGERDASVADSRREHPAVRARWPRAKRIDVPLSQVICGTPAVGRAAVALGRAA